MKRPGERWQKVYGRTWTDPWFVSLASEHRLLWLYLLTCPEYRSEGLFRLNVREASRCVGADVLGALGDFNNQGRCWFDPECDVVLIPNALGYSPTKNKNDAVGIVNRLSVFHNHWMVNALAALAELYDPKLHAALSLYCNDLTDLEAIPELVANQLADRFHLGFTQKQEA